MKTSPLIATSAACLSSHARLAALRSRAIPPEAEQKFFTRIPQQCGDLTDLKKWTVRKTAADKNPTFLVPLPIVSKWLVNVEIEAVAAAQRQFPCHVKRRYKYLDIIHRSGSIQTEPSDHLDRMMGDVLEAFERNQ
jgi:hypothetical protein